MGGSTDNICRKLSFELLNAFIPIFFSNIITKTMITKTIRKNLYLFAK
ncbi:hypothetical protein [Terrisporobacter petrolearius]